jgi:hypothetical protein
VVVVEVVVGNGSGTEVDVVVVVVVVEVVAVSSSLVRPMRKPSAPTARIARAAATPMATLFTVVGVMARGYRVPMDAQDVLATPLTGLAPSTERS